jgi:hypothetical protein
MGYVREHDMRGPDIWLGYASGSLRWPFAVALGSLRRVLVRSREFVLANFGSTPHRGDWSSLTQFEDRADGNITRIR